jgi:hypothetical protein
MAASAPCRPDSAAARDRREQPLKCACQGHAQRPARRWLWDARSARGGALRRLHGCARSGWHDVHTLAVSGVQDLNGSQMALGSSERTLELVYGRLWFVNLRGHSRACCGLGAALDQSRCRQFGSTRPRVTPEVSRARLWCAVDFAAIFVFTFERGSGACRAVPSQRSVGKMARLQDRGLRSAQQPFHERR